MGGCGSKKPSGGADEPGEPPAHAEGGPAKGGKSPGGGSTDARRRLSISDVNAGDLAAAATADAAARGGGGAGGAGGQYGGPKSPPGMKRRRLSITGESLQSATGMQLEHRQAVPGERDCGVTGRRAQHLPLRWGQFSRAGNDPMKRRKENQDSMLVVDTFGDFKDQLALMVYDGHGPFGGQASQFVRDALTGTWLDRGLARATGRAEIERIMHDGCVETNARLAMSDIDVYVSGSTGVTGLVKGNTIYVANVGDSRAVLARLVPAEGQDLAALAAAGKEPEMVLRAVDLSDDQKPDRPDEERRIVDAGGRVFEWGVPRVWRKEVDMPGLAMSRSYGDLAAESVGVFAEPEITETVLGAEDRFLIFASDGVWEFITSQEACDLVAPFLEDDPQAREV